MIQDFLAAYDLSAGYWLLAGACAMLIGMSKTGVSGVGLAVVPLMATIFGSKPSTGMLLPILIMADLFAVKYYNRHAEWKYVWKILPWALIGVAIGAIVGKNSTPETFNYILAACVLIGVGLMIWKDLKKDMSIPRHWAFAASLGLAGGFITMVGNAAGPIMSLYLLSMRLPKNIFIGTAAWFFLIINVIKVPLHIFIWDTITLDTFMFDLAMLPAIAIGAFLGIKVVKIFNEKAYRILVIGTTILASILIFFK